MSSTTDRYGGRQPGTLTRATVRSAVSDLTGRFIDVATTADPAHPVPATPGWTVRDVAAHLITTVDRYARGPHGDMPRVSDPADLPALNDALLRGRDWAPPPELFAQLRHGVQDLLDQVDGYGEAQPSYLFNGDGTVRADQALGILAGELAVHGADVAAVAGAPWPVTATDVESVLYGMEPVLPGWLDPRRSRGHSASYDIRIRGGGRHRWTFRDGQLDCTGDPRRPVDCHLSAVPGALLRVMYRRRSPGTVALTGRVVSWGRRPWLALSLADRFYPP